MTNYNYIEIPRMNMKSSIFAEFVKRIKELEMENEQLKELLKECRRYIDIWGYEDTHGRAILPQIDEVLNE